MRLFLSLVLILAALGSALLLQQELTSGEDATAHSSLPRAQERDRLQLRLGQAPILVLKSQRPIQARHPSSPPPSPEPRPRPAPRTQRFVTLEPGGTLSEVAEKELGTFRRLNEILELNGWTRTDLRHLRAGTRILLPPR